MIVIKIKGEHAEHKKVCVMVSFGIKQPVRVYVRTHQECE